MPYRLPPLAALRAFEAAARLLSFKKAAAELHVTPAAVSQQIKTLEAYLGVPLFRRLTRALELTEAGQAMLPKLREGFDCLVAALAATRRDTPTGRLAVSAPPSFAARWLVPRLGNFMASHPDIELHLSSTADMIDRLNMSSAPPGSSAHAGDEVAIRFGSGRYPGRQCDLLFAPEYILVCSPRLLTSKRPLRTPRDVGRHALIHDETIPDAALRPTWDAWLQRAAVTGVDATRGLRFGNSTLALQAAVDGLGVALAMRPLIEGDLASGRLVAPFDIAVASVYAYFLTAPEPAAERQAIKAFRAWLLDVTAPWRATPSS